MTVVGTINSILLTPCKAQTIIHQELFNDDGEGTRYFVVGRGANPDGGDGPGIWDLRSQIGKVGLVDVAPARRAAILWAHDTFPNNPEDFWTDDALSIFTNVIDWAIEGQQNATIYMLPDTQTTDADAFIAEMLAGAGHTVHELLEGEDIPVDAELIINSSAATQAGPFLTDKEVPVVSYFATNHDGTAITKKGVEEPIDPSEISIATENEGHPVLGGRTGTITWTNDPSIPLQGLGEEPKGSTVLATYMSPAGIERPAIVLIDKGESLIGTFNPLPEGSDYWVGGDLNLDFGDGFQASPDEPRVLEINPVDVSGFADVKLTLGLAATDADFEGVDFLRISIDPQNSGDFQVLADFHGVDEVGSPIEAALLDNIDGTTFLTSDAFTDVTYDIPDDATELVVRIEAYSTFPNEVVGIDNLRITSNRVVLQPGDSDMDLDFDQLDLVNVSIAGKYLTGSDATWGEGDWNGAPGGQVGAPPLGNGKFDQGDIIAALGAGQYLQGPYAALVAGGREGDDQTSLVYDAKSGELSVDAPAGKNLTSINVSSDANMFIGDKPAALDGAFDNFTADNVFKATFGGSFGSIGFGAVLPAGLLEDELATDLTVVGSLAGGGDLGNVDLVYVPEPNSAWLLALGLFLLIRRQVR